MSPQGFTVLAALLTQGNWEAARPYFRVLARDVARRAEGVALRRLLGQVPPEVQARPDWQEALVWVAYRSGDGALLAQVLGQSPDRFLAFAAYQAAWVLPWETVLERAEQGLDATDPAERGVAARYRAVALARLGREGWVQAFREAAERQKSPRDRGLVCLEFGHQLVTAGREELARDLWAQAVTLLRQDTWAQTQALSNLGTTCLRLEELEAAQRAYSRAAALVQGPESRGQLSIAWRGLGSLYMWSGQVDRSAHAFAMAEQTADDIDLTVLARRGQARLLRLRGHLDEALEVLHSALMHAGVAGAPHPLYADLAAVQVLVGDSQGAASSLDRVSTGDVTDAWRAQVVRAELARQAGDGGFARHLAGIDLRHLWTREESRAFAEVLAAVGVHSPLPAWTIDVSLDGPIEVRTATGRVPLRPASPEASLLALLLTHGRALSVERVLELVDLTGTSPREQKKTLNKVVRRLAEALGWRAAVTHTRTLVALADTPVWQVTVPTREDRLDYLCEGCLDPWVTEARSVSLQRSLVE